MLQDNYADKPLASNSAVLLSSYVCKLPNMYMYY